MAYPTGFVRFCITAVLLLSEYAFGSTLEQGHIVTQTTPMLLDSGRLVS